MTQKELSYFEDAIKHEENVIKIIDMSIASLSDPSLIDFMKDERIIHQGMKEKLINMLEVKSNE